MVLYRSNNKEAFMRKTSRILVLSAVLIALFSLAAMAAQQKAEDMVKDPVCGMSFAKSEAKASFDYKGTTYFFCSVACKDKFAQDPEKYLQKDAGKTAKVVKAEKVAKEEKAGCTCPKCQGKTPEMTGKCPHCGQEMSMPKTAQGQGCLMMQGKMTMPHGQMAEGMGKMSCPMAVLMHGKDVELKIENTKDGIQITLSSKEAEMVKKIQDAAAKMKAGCESKDCGGDCFDK